MKRITTEVIEAKNNSWRESKYLNEILKAEATVDHNNTAIIA
jgi:hypothetical protein